MLVPNFIEYVRRRIDESYQADVSSHNESDIRTPLPNPVETLIVTKVEPSLPHASLASGVRMFDENCETVSECNKFRKLSRIVCKLNRLGGWRYYRSTVPCTSRKLED